MKHGATPTDTSLDFELEADADVTLGVKLENYQANDFKYDHIRLYCTGTTIPTSITDAHAGSNTQHKNGKFLENGKIVILKDSRKYNVTGQQLSTNRE